MKSERSKQQLELDTDYFVKEASCLWMNAMRAHRCVACAEKDIAQKVAMTRELSGDLDTSAFGCMEFCKDVGWSLKAVGIREPVGHLGGQSGMGRRLSQRDARYFSQILEVSMDVIAAWGAAMTVGDCAGCAETLLLKKINDFAQETRRFIPVGGAREGFRRVCNCCQGQQNHLV